MTDVRLTAQGFRISDERYFESEKGAQRALQAGYLGWNKHRYTWYLECI